MTSVITMNAAASSSSKLTCLEDAQISLSRFEEIINNISQLCNSQEVVTEEDFNVMIKSKVDEATTRSQKLAVFFHENRKHRAESEFKQLHNGFVQAMHKLQSAHQSVTRKRELICDRTLMDQVEISISELEIAKEEEAKAVTLAEDAVEVKELFKEINTIVHDQKGGIEVIEKSVEHTKFEIGKGISELEQAAQLQKEARQRVMLIGLIILAILSAIIVPLIMYISNNSK